MCLLSPPGSQILLHWQVLLRPHVYIRRPLKSRKKLSKLLERSVLSVLSHTDIVGEAAEQQMLPLHRQVFLGFNAGLHEGRISNCFFFFLKTGAWMSWPVQLNCLFCWSKLSIRLDKCGIIWSLSYHHSMIRLIFIFLPILLLLLFLFPVGQGS